MTLWTVHPRNKNLTRTLDPVAGFTRLELVERYNAPDTWVLTGPPSALSVFSLGMGCVLTRTVAGPTTVQVASGKVRAVRRSATFNQDSGRIEDVMQVGFVSDLRLLYGRLAYPDPTHALSTTLSTFADSHDVRTGAIETLILGYIADNAGAAAPITSRRNSALALPTSLGRGGSTTKKARMDRLGEMVAELAESGGLRVNVGHDESTGTPRLLLSIDPVPDKSANVIFGSPDSLRASAFITEWEYSVEAPELTDAVLFAAGQQDAREAALFSDAGAISLWGERVESLVDQRQTDDQSEINRAGAEALASGAAPASVSFKVSDSTDIVHRRDYGVGNKVGLDLPGQESLQDNVVREALTVVEAEKADQLTITIGSNGASAQRTRLAARMDKALRRVAALERSA